MAYMPLQRRQRQGLVCSLLLVISSVLLSACGGQGAGSQAQAVSPTMTPIDWKQVDQAMGKAGVPQPGGVYRYSLPRTDLKVTLGGVPLKAGFALGGFAAFLPMGNGAMAMGDLVLSEDEINPVLSKLQQGGIQ